MLKEGCTRRQRQPAAVRNGARVPSEMKNRYPWWACRVWNGMDMRTWFGLLARHRLAVSPSIGRMHIVASAILFAPMNSLLNAIQGLFYRRKIARTKIEPPIFIVGHWRSGTTFLHELLARDPNLTAPTSYECFAPGHFHVSAPLFTKFEYLIPGTRPMDEMKMSWSSPQEDEFALLNLGLPSPYEELAFPNHRRAAAPFLSLSELTPGALEKWKRGFVTFIQSVSLKRAKERRGAVPRLVLKSPPHTARIEFLCDLLPEAKFIHLVRNPTEVFSSTVRLWTSLFDVQGCQTPRLEQLPNGAPSIEDYVLATFDALYRDFPGARAQLPAHQFCELRYEDLVANPLQELQRVYDQLELSGFEAARPQFLSYLKSVREYRPAQHEVSEDAYSELRRRWLPYFETYGY